MSMNMYMYMYIYTYMYTKINKIAHSSKIKIARSIID